MKLVAASKLKGEAKAKVEVTVSKPKMILVAWKDELNKSTN